MTELSQMNCVSVEKGASLLLPAEVERYHRQVPDWRIVGIVRHSRRLIA